MTLNTVAALVVRLMDLYNIRVGSDEYAKANESYGLTTLKSMHVKHLKGDDAEGRHDACSRSRASPARTGTSPSRTTNWWI